MKRWIASPNTIQVIYARLHHMRSGASTPTRKVQTPHTLKNHESAQNCNKRVPHHEHILTIALTLMDCKAITHNCNINDNAANDDGGKSAETYSEITNT